MPYIGRAATNTGNVRYLDDIASGFDGSDTTFTAQVGGVSITPDQESVKIFLDGVFQHPGSGNAYTISGSTITFTAAPVANTVFSAYVVGAGAYLDDNAVSSAKLDDDAVTAAKLDDDGTGFQVGDLGVGGSLTSGDKLTVTGRLRASGGIIGDLTGNVTGNASGTALTVTQAAQTAITSVGTLTGLTVATDNENIARFDGLQGNIDFRYGSDIEFDRAGQVYITANNGSGELNFRTGGQNIAMHIDSSQRVGIGTSTINANLVIENSDGVQLALQDSSDPGWGFKKDRVSSSENLYFGTMTKAGTFSSKHTFHEGGAVTFGGQVGIGETPDAASRLLVDHDQNAYTRILVKNTDTGSAAQSVTHYETDVGSFTCGAVSDAHSLDGAALLWHVPNKNMVFATNNTQQMSIGSNGMLTVSPNISGDYAMFVNQGNSAGWGMRVAGGADNDDYIFRGQNGSGTDKFVVKSGGHVGIGTNSPSAMLFIDQDSNATAFKIDSESTTLNCLTVEADALTTGSAGYFYSNSGATNARRLFQIQNDNNASDDTVAFYIQQDSNEFGAEIKATESAFSTSVAQLETERVGDAAFQFLTTLSSHGGSTDVQHNLRGQGDVLADGVYDSGGADYAEYFESKDGNAMTVGVTVKLDGDKVVACEDGDIPIGVVRPRSNTAVIGNSAPFKWTGKYLKDDYGAYIEEEYTVTEWVDGKNEDGSNNDIQYHTDKIPSDVTVPSDATVISTEKNGTKLIRRKINPDYDESKSYKPREERDEWCLIGLLGQIPITKGQPMASNWIKMKDISDTVEMWMVK